MPIGGKAPDCLVDQREIAHARVAHFFNAHIKQGQAPGAFKGLRLTVQVSSEIYLLITNCFFTTPSLCDSTCMK